MDQSRVRLDVRKAHRNLAKHDVAFVAALSALDDPGLRTWSDPTGRGMERDVILGIDVYGRLLYLVMEDQPDGTIRLISARRATKREQHAYSTGTF